MEIQGTIVIDGWRIDPDSNRIARDGVEERLEPRSMELLVYLAERAGQVVSREEIEDAVWQGRVVSYEALSGSIAKLRKAFGDNGKQHRVIETIPKSGYRLIAPVSQSEPGAKPAPDIPAAGAKSPGSKLILVIPALCILVAGLMLWHPWAVSPRSISDTVLSLPDKPSIAVLPCINLSNDSKQSYFADGFTDDLITDLSKNPDLFVISRNSTFLYRGEALDIRKVAAELGVRYVIECSVQRIGDQVRINVQLIDATTGGHAWANRYDGSLDDIFAMRDQINEAVVAEISGTLVGSYRQAETESFAAYDAMLRGQDHYRLFTPDDLIEAIPFVEKALELDPDYGRAHGLMAAVYWGICNNSWWSSAGMTYEDCDQKTSDHLAEAMKNPTPLAHRIAARQHEYNQRWVEALSEAAKAIALNPNDPNGYQALSALEVNLGDPAKGLEYIEKAIRLDPQSDYLWRLGYAQFHLERYAEAAETMQQATTRNPDYDWNYLLLAAAYGHLDRLLEAHEALATFNRLREKFGTHSPFRLSDLQYWSIKNEAGLERLRVGMRKAGVPDT